MYKIINDISILSAINDTANENENKNKPIEDKNTDIKYCEPIKHPVRDEWAIPIIEPILRGYNLPFIDELLSSLVEELPEDWNWIFPTQIRIIIPNYLILKEPYLKALINYCNENNVPNFVDKECSYVYVNEIYPEHQAIFSLYDEIKIETK